MNKLVKLPSFANVAAGQTATLRMPVGLTYEKLVIAYIGVTLAQLKSITLEINGRQCQFYNDGVDLDDINKYYGRPAAAGELTLYFRRPELDSVEMDRLTGLGTADVQTLQLKIDVDAGAAAPVLTGYATQRGAENLGLFTKVRRYNFSSAVSGEVEVAEIPRGPRIAAVHFKKADVNSIVFEADSVKIVEATKAVLQRLQLEDKRVPVAGYTVVDFMLEGDIGDAFVSARLQDMRFRPTLGTSGSMPFYVEFLDTFSGV